MTIDNLSGPQELTERDWARLGLPDPNIYDEGYDGRSITIPLSAALEFPGMPTEQLEVLLPQLVGFHGTRMNMRARVGEDRLSPDKSLFLKYTGDLLVATKSRPGALIVDINEVPPPTRGQQRLQAARRAVHWLMTGKRAQKPAQERMARVTGIHFPSIS